MTRLTALLLTLLMLVGCKTDAAQEAAQDTTAHKFHTEGCEVCGMIVREQPAPRGQLVHRDGKRVFFCSVADMLTYVDVPSPHGKPASVYIEGSDPSADPKTFGLTQLAWIDATSASYVTGVENPMIMGFPILTYSNSNDADDVANKVDGKVHNWTAIKAFSQNRQDSK